MWSKKALAAFRFLGIRPTTDEADIKRAYLQAAKKYHPDKNPADRENAERKFKELQDHMLVLKNERQAQAFQASDDEVDSDVEVPPVMVDDESWLDSLASSFANMGFDLNIFGVSLNAGRLPLTVNVPPAIMIHGGSVNIDLPCGAKVRLNVLEGTFAGDSIGLRTPTARYMVSLQPDLPDGADDTDGLVSLVVEPLLTDLLLRNPVSLPMLDRVEDRPLDEEEIRNGEVYVSGGGLPLPEGFRGDLRVIIRPVLPNLSDPSQRQLVETLHDFMMATS